MEIPQDPFLQGQSLTIDEAAQRLNITTQSLQELMNAGDIQYREHRGEPLITINELDSYRTRSRIGAERRGSHEVPRPVMTPEQQF